MSAPNGLNRFGERMKCAISLPAGVRNRTSVACRLRAKRSANTRMRSYFVILLCAGTFSTALADDFETQGERRVLDRQLAPFGLPGWHPLKPASQKAPQALSQNSPEARLRIERLNQKLDSIKIPTVEFRGTPLRDALSWLHDAAKQNDVGSTEPEKGVNIVIKLDSMTYNPSITLSLTNVTVREALTQIVAPFDIEVEVRQFAVAVVRRP